MLTRKALFVAAATAALLAVLAAPAFAGDKFGDAACSENPHPGCDLLAGESGTAPAPAPSGGSPSADGTGQGRKSAPTPRPDGSLDEAKTARCAYVRSGYQPPAAAAQPVLYRPPAPGGLVVRPAVFASSKVSVRPVAAQPGQGPGAWYVFQCTSPGARDALYRPPVWIPDAAPGAAPDPEALAEQARNRLGLDGPRIGMSPVGDQLVRLPTWLWLDAAGWHQAAATAAADGVSVTAVARPVAVVWSMGDGATVTCNGPGTQFKAGGDPKAASPDCGYTYRSRSLDSPGGAFRVTATVRWDVSWAGAGRAGVFPGLTTVSATAARVIDIPALTTGGG
jgi:hypothetical protein